MRPVPRSSRAGATRLTPRPRRRACPALEVSGELYFFSNICLSSANSRLEKCTRAIRLVPKCIAENFKQHAEGGAARLPYCRFAAWQPKLPEMADPFESKRRCPAELAAPDRAIRPEPGAVPCDTQYRRLKAILRHAREHMRDSDAGRIRRRGQPRGELRGKIIGVHIARDGLAESHRKAVANLTPSSEKGRVGRRRTQDRRYAG